MKQVKRITEADILHFLHERKSVTIGYPLDYNILQIVSSYLLSEFFFKEKINILIIFSNTNDKKHFELTAKESFEEEFKIDVEVKDNNHYIHNNNNFIYITLDETEGMATGVDKFDYIYVHNNSEISNSEEVMLLNAMCDCLIISTVDYKKSIFYKPFIKKRFVLPQVNLEEKLKTFTGDEDHLIALKAKFNLDGF